MSVCLLFVCMLHYFWNISRTFLYSLSGCIKIKKFTYIILLKGAVFRYFWPFSVSYYFYLYFLCFGNFSFFPKKIWYVYIFSSLLVKETKKKLPSDGNLRATLGVFLGFFSWAYLTVRYFFTVMVTSLQKVFTVCLSLLTANLEVFWRNFKVWSSFYWHRFNIFWWNITQMFFYYFDNKKIDINMACWFLVRVIFWSF